MVKRTLFFTNPYHLSTRNRQLKIKPPEGENIKTVPLEDLGYLVLEHPQITLSQSAIALCSEMNVAVIFCDQKFLPTSMLLHLNNNTTETEKFRAQIKSSQPLNKQLWQQTIKAKIKNQAMVLANFNKQNEALNYLTRQVRSGDPDNIEGRAARIYWKALFGKEFVRDRSGFAPNHLLNYGYTILRAATARALCGSGLLPAIGIHHRNKYNSFCLADDIMEPYRPFCDALVYEIFTSMQSDRNYDLSTEVKMRLIGLMAEDTNINKKNRPLMTALSESTASLARCFLGTGTKLHYPIIIRR